MLAAGRGAALPVPALRKRLGSQLDTLQALGAAASGPPLSIVTCPACYAGHSAEVDYDPAKRRSSIFCAEAGRVGVADVDLATVRPNLRWLPDQLTSLLEIKPSPPRRILIEGAAWWLGDIVVGRTELSLSLAIGIRIGAEEQRLVEKLQRIQPSHLGLLLTADTTTRAYILDQARYLPAPIEDFIWIDASAVHVDHLRLAVWVRGSLDRCATKTLGRRGRPSQKNQITTLFDERRLRGERFVSKLHEAKSIEKEWTIRFPDENAPSLSTIRSHLPQAEP